MKLENLRRQAEYPREDVVPRSKRVAIALLCIGIIAIVLGFSSNIQGVILLGGFAVSGGISGLLFFRPKRAQTPVKHPAEIPDGPSIAN